VVNANADKNVDFPTCLAVFSMILSFGQSYTSLKGACSLKLKGFPFSWSVACANCDEVIILGLLDILAHTRTDGKSPVLSCLLNFLCYISGNDFIAT